MAQKTVYVWDEERLHKAGCRDVRGIKDEHYTSPANSCCITGEWWDMNCDFYDEHDDGISGCYPMDKAPCVDLPLDCGRGHLPIPTE